jgi:S1-C subfamily serine protease
MTSRDSWSIGALRNPNLIPPEPPRQRRGAGIGTLLVVSLAAAAIASVGTVAILQPLAPAPPVDRQVSVPPPVLIQAGPPPVPTPSGSPADGSGGQSVIVTVAGRVSPAVVTITSDIAGNSLNPFSLPETGVGSGFIYDTRGWILTNNHVVEGASTLTVQFKNGRELPARVVRTDPDADLAVIKVDETGLPTVEIGSSAGLQVGQLVVAIGSPLGTFSESVTSGILSAVGRTITVRNSQTRRPRTMTGLLQTDAAINPGNSGGPLLDQDGRVIGLNTAVASTAQGIGFAIPIDTARDIMTQALAGSV